MNNRFLIASGIVTAIVFSLAFTTFPSSTTKLDDEKYKVIKVNGQIVYKKSGKNLQQGDEFLSSVILDFKTAEARAAVISPSKGRFVLTADSKGKTNLVPGMNNISSRAGALLNQVDLENHFSGKYVILDQQKLKVSKEVYPMDANNFFFLQYLYNGEVINKKLAFDGDTLILNRQTIFTIDGKQVDALSSVKSTLFYRKSEKNENYRISEFTTLYPSLVELKNELSILIDNSPAKKNSEKLDEIAGYMLEFYGKVDSDNLHHWLKENKLL